MNKLISTIRSAALLTASLAFLSAPVSAKTTTPIKNEQRAAAAKAHTKAKAEARKQK
jgi:hypothetical protein